MRQLSTLFLNNLKDEMGILHPILKRIKQDDTLMLAIREGYINIYYRGGNLLKIEEKSNNSFSAYFDANYIKSADIQFSDLNIPTIITAVEDAQKCVQAIPHIKEVMDFYFSANNKPEREYQQVVARENNYSTISNESEYFISDIESSDTQISARFDMLAIKWRANQRKNGDKCVPVFIEMKYGDDALCGASGIVKHLADFNKLISDSTSYEKLISEMETQFEQLCTLGLVAFNKSKNFTKILFDRREPPTPEVIFMLANHNPRSTKLRTELMRPEVKELIEKAPFDLKFFVSRFAGYGMHHDCMVNLKDFIKLLENTNS